MMDEREDRLDAMLRDAARDYNAPPATPKAELWERIAAERAVRQSGGQADDVIPFRPPVRLTARPSFRLGVGIAALLALGVAIGRITAPGNPAGPGAAPAGTQVATAPTSTGTTTTPAATEPAGSDPRTSEPSDRGTVAAQFATVQHLGQVESFLTEFNTAQAARDFSGQAQDLLSTTRLLLDSRRLTDVRTRKLLEDLELVLVQIATLNPRDRREELGFIADGLAQSHLRTRIRNALPAGPTVRM